MAREAKNFLKTEREKWKISAQGVFLAAKELRFWVTFVLVFLIFGTILNLLNSGTAGVALLFNGNFSVLGKAFLAIFGAGRSFSDFLLTFLILFLQSTLIATVTVVAKHNLDDNKVTAEEHEKTKTGVQNSGLVAGLAILGSGCPTCGTALITPVLGMIFSTGGLAMAGVISGAITTLAIIVAIFSLRAAGIDAHAGILKVCPRFLAKSRTAISSAKSRKVSAAEKVMPKVGRKVKEENGKDR